jgi:hypothetical protein
LSDTRSPKDIKTPVNELARVFLIIHCRDHDAANHALPGLLKHRSRGSLAFEGATRGSNISQLQSNY